MSSANRPLEPEATVRLILQVLRLGLAKTPFRRDPIFPFRSHFPCRFYAISDILRVIDQKFSKLKSVFVDFRH